MSKIEWTEATWNPIVGCSKVSPGCQNCYAERMATRLIAMGQEKYRGTVASGKWTGVINFDERVLEEPLRRKKPTRYFVNSMSDLFHENIPHQSILKILAVIAASPQHTFQILTKRPQRMLKFFTITSIQEQLVDALEVLAAKNGWCHAHDDFAWPLPHLWLGVSAENQKTANKRIPYLLSIPAAVRFLSCEPLLGPIDLKKASFENVDWVIIGGESGPGARPLHPDWVLSLRDQCQASKIPFFFKQWGAFKPICPVYGDDEAQEWLDASYAHNLNPEKTRIVFNSGHCHNWPHQENWQPDSQSRPYFMERVGKKHAGRELEGRIWNEFPEVIHMEEIKE